MRVRQYFKGLLAWTFFLFLGACSGRNRAPNMIQLRTRPAVINMAPFQPNWFINLNCINKIQFRKYVRVCITFNKLLQLRIKNNNKNILRNMVPSQKNWFINIKSINKIVQKIGTGMYGITFNRLADCVHYTVV